MIDLNELKNVTWEIGKKRIENGAKLSDGDFLKHCAGELVEAVIERNNFDNHLSEIYDWDYESFVEKANEIKKRYSHELADIIICVLNEAAKTDIDIENAILEVIEKNKLRAERKGDKL